MGRRIRGEGAFYQRADGIWIGVVDLGIHNGKRRRKTVSGKTKKIAQTKFVALKREVEKGGGLTANITVEEWLNHWIETIASKRVRERTLQGYKVYLKTWLIPYLGSKRLDKLNEDHIRAMYREMEMQGKADSTQRLAHAILHRALVVAERESRITRNPAEKMDAPHVAVVNRNPLTLEQAQQILASLDGNPLAARWVGALLLGLRQGEALGLKWEDIDMEAETIKIRRELIRITGKGMVETPPKSVKSIRTIPMLGPMKYALEKTEHRGEYVFYGEAKNPRGDWQNWKELLIRSGVYPAGMAFGDMPQLAAARTTTGTLLRNAGVPDTVSRDIMGHSQVQVTQESYQRTDQITMKKAMKALELSVSPSSRGEASLATTSLPE